MKNSFQQSPNGAIKILPMQVTTDDFQSPSRAIDVLPVVITTGDPACLNCQAPEGRQNSSVSALRALEAVWSLLIRWLSPPAWDLSALWDLLNLSSGSYCIGHPGFIALAVLAKYF